MAQETAMQPGRTATLDVAPVYHVISHTHWDREWHLPFEQMRLRLVELIDNLLQILAEQPRYIFHLDAQTVVIEDYLAIRPRRRAELEAHVRAGRLLIGPWYVQNDFFLTSGEATIRNLLIGTRIAGELGRCGRVGYAPDQFGLIGQLPQILNGFGIDTCVFGRGYTPDPVTQPIEFNWLAGGGSRVFALNLPCWYNNAQRFSADPGRAADFLRLIETNLLPFMRTPYRLLMNGVDHLEAQEDLLPILDRLNEALPDGSIAQVTMQEHVDAVRAALAPGQLHQHRGELRQGGNDYVLQNTLSSRVYLKQANVRIQQRLELGLEPLHALLGQVCGIAWPADPLDYIWRELLKTHPHDNICGCSCDGVHRSMEERQARLMQMLDWLIERGMKQLAERLDRAPMNPSDLLLLLVNPLPCERRGVFEVTVDFPVDQAWQDFEILDPAGRPVVCEVLAITRQRLGTFSPINLPGQLTVVSARLLLQLPALPACGWQVLRIAHARPGHGHALAAPAPAPAQSTAEPCTLTNDALQVTVHANGRIDLLDRQSGEQYPDVLGFSDEADLGNSYLFRAAPGGAPVRLPQVPLRMRPSANALRQRVELDFEWQLPARYDLEAGQRTAARVIIPATLVLQLDQGSSRLDIFLELDHRAQDHRLRLLVRPGIAGDTTWVASPFELVARSRAALHAGPRREFSEPNAGLVHIADDRRAMTVLNEGLAEYEHLDARTGELALTLVRANAIICDNAFAEPAEGETLLPSHHYQVPDNQCLRPLSYRVALQPGTTLAGCMPALQEFMVAPLVFEDAADERVFVGGRPCVQDTKLAETFYRRPSDAERVLPLQNSLLSLHGASTTCTAFKRAEADDQWVLRMNNPAPQADAIELRFVQPPREVQRLRLDETPIAPLPMSEGVVRLTLQPGEICTLGLRW